MRLCQHPESAIVKAEVMREASSRPMEISGWRVRLRRLRRWSRYEGRASDGQFDTADLPIDDKLRTASNPAAMRHSMSSADDCDYYEPVVPPVCIPHLYRQQDRQRGVRVGGDRVPFTYDGHMRRRKLVRALDRIHESEPLDTDDVPDMRNSMAAIRNWKGRGRRCTM
ncbi:hypothetical protein Poli38472_012491 [Pythium oligandrum]|uniref:Uncharacterized protein n=1 Tax=Pythium oligandrum TaxID=41045 RepID=A0A8K1CPZ1_PYTOL|nr:hypothetical protein Poli38472_012491 [Pythium oligandrum]|eukprot:TMW67375.1 hypothetical protein Poli38472_012491 [Pythium oligandrum]